MKRLSLIALTVSALSACSGGNTTAPTPVTPAAPTIISVALSGNLVALNKKGATTQTFATATLSNNATQDVTATCSNWQSDSPGVVTVNGGGLLTAQSSGSATISTTCQTVSARGSVTLTVATKAIPTLNASIVVGISPEPLFLFRAKVTYVIAETSGAYGINVNFLNTQITQGGVTSPVKNYNPSVFGSIWGTNHIGAGQSNSVVETIDYNGGGVSPVSTTYTLSVGDDLGNQFSTTNVVSGHLLVALPSLAGRDPYASRFVP